MKIGDSVDWNVHRSVGAEFIRGDDGRIYIDFGAQFGSNYCDIVAL